MAIDYPTDIDDLHDPETGDTLDTAGHISIEKNQNNAIEALETKVGTDDSADTDSLDFLVKNPASVDPGHTHTSSATVDQTLTDGANIAWDLDLGQVAHVTLTDNRTLSNPTNLAVGTYILRIIQDAGGTNTLAYGNVYKWPSGIAPVLTTAGNAIDIISFYCDGTYMYGSILKAFATP